MLRVLVFINKLGTGAFYLVYMNKALFYCIMADVQDCFSSEALNFSHRSVQSDLTTSSRTAVGRVFLRKKFTILGNLSSM